MIVSGTHIDKRVSLNQHTYSTSTTVSPNPNKDVKLLTVATMPTDAEYEASLRNAVREHYANPEEEATVRSMRTKSEQDLGLDEGFYKNDDVWKDKSKQIIQDQFTKCEEEQNEKTEEAVENKKSLKRASPSTSSRPRKKSKLEEEEESTALSEPPESSVEDDSAEEEEDYAPKKKAARKPPAKTAKAAAKAKPAPSTKAKPTAKAKKDSSTSELSDAPSEPLEDAVPSKTTKDDADDSSSELSSVIDEPQPSRKSSKSKNGSVSKSSTSKSKPKAAAESDPKAEEIKRLQGWLVKCGIRKVWGKELKPFTTQNAKISHLKSMLSDAGMTGRFSNEKAAQIKEARELAADIEAVQEGNERWGKDGEDEEEEAERGGRRLVRGAKNYAFLSSDGEEESD